jgi:hypothetical protein
MTAYLDTSFSCLKSAAQEVVRSKKTLLEVALLLHKLVGLGYEEQGLKWRLRSHLGKFTWVYPAIKPSHQYSHILQEYSRLTFPLVPAGV